MKVYWKEHKIGLRLILEDAGEELEVGLIRRTPRGYDAMAKTTGYDPGRAQKDIPTIEEAQAFVESFHPWLLFGGTHDLKVDPKVRPAS